MTLVELLCVMAIIGILTAATVFHFSLARGRATDSRAAAAAKEIVTQAQLYVYENNALPGAANMPQILWNRGAPGGVVYIPPTCDPWGATPAANFRYNEASADGITGEVRSWSIGLDQTGTMSIGGACGGGAIGYSNFSGACRF